MNRKGIVGKSHTIDTILITLMNEQGCSKDQVLRLAKTGKLDCLIERYTVNSHKSGISIPTGNIELNVLPPNKLRINRPYYRT